MDRGDVIFAGVAVLVVVGTAYYAKKRIGEAVDGIGNAIGGAVDGAFSAVGGVVQDIVSVVPPVYQTQIRETFALGPVLAGIVRDPWGALQQSAPTADNPGLLM
ncbi:hypothetical protein [Herbaspirillum aquaticum]|uniref:hypothetical protein n=1 Tax=Herbaspirillum aquaticum TaxID=568783 RepID=UPI0024DEABB4|nr:hypothetical protein [Herbaspirillum aquaticum]